MKIEFFTKATSTSSEGQTFYANLPVIVLGCKHKNIYQGYWFRGMCVDCKQYIDELVK